MQSRRRVLRPPADVPSMARSPSGRDTLGARCAAWRSFVAAAVLLGSTPSAAPAWAHAVPATMDPAPNARLDASPREVAIRFSERVEARPSTLEVLDTGGRRVDVGGAAVDPADPWRYRVAVRSLPDGAYTVSWRVLSADDGHITSGAHVFTIGVASSAGAAVGESGPTVWGGVGWRPFARWLVAVGGRFSWALASPARWAALGRLDGREAWRPWEGWPWRSAGLSISWFRRTGLPARARWLACSRPSCAPRPASCGSLEAGFSCCCGCCPHRVLHAARPPLGFGGCRPRWPFRS